MRKHVFSSFCLKIQNEYEKISNTFYRKFKFFYTCCPKIQNKYAKISNTFYRKNPFLLFDSKIPNKYEKISKTFYSTQNIKKHQNIQNEYEKFTKPFIAPKLLLHGREMPRMLPNHHGELSLICIYNKCAPYAMAGFARIITLSNRLMVSLLQVFSHAQTVVVCSGCSTVLCQSTGGRARLTEG